MRTPSFFFFLAISIFLATTQCSNGLAQPSSLFDSSSQLTYHKGPILTGPNPINTYIIWYGAFSPKHKSTISDFFASFKNPTAPHTVSSWWKTTQLYKDTTGKSVSSDVKLSGEVSDGRYSLGKKLKRIHIAYLVKKAIERKTFPADSNGIYLVLTAADVTVEQFCMNSCGYHNSISVSPKQKVVYAHVGDPSTQCPGLCAWPYATPAFGPPGKALIAPNGVGIDGIVINVATVLAGASTNPFQSGYYQGDVRAPLEALTACAGIFGEGAYSGNPGKLLVDVKSKGSYNVNGVNGSKFAVPAMWDLSSKTCKVGA